MPGFRDVFPKMTLIVLAIVAAVAGYFTICSDMRQSWDKGVGNPNDFVTLYAGSICTASDCNPYEVSQLDTVLRNRRGTAVVQDWTDQLPIYPPTTLFLLRPFGGLPYRKATLAWYVISLSIYVAGIAWTFLVSHRLRGKSLLLRTVALLLALHFPKMIQCLSFGNPSLVVTGLLLFAVFDRNGAFYIARVVCAAVAVWLKFTVALPLMLLVVFSDVARLRRAWISFAVFTVITTAVLVYAAHPAGMHHWVADLRQEVAVGEQNGMSVSGRISPSNVLLNAANIPGYFTRNALVIRCFVVLVFGALTVPFISAILRMYPNRWGSMQYDAAIPVVAVLSLLPVYHRFCDSGLLLFVIPWLICRVSRLVDWIVLFAATDLGLLYFSWERRIHLESFGAGSSRKILEFLYYRGDALLVLILAALLVTSFCRDTWPRTNGLARL